MPGWSTIALSLCTSARTQSKLVAVRVIGLLRRAATADAGGDDAGEVPDDRLGDAVERQDLVGEAGLAIAPGMPQTTEVAWSWTTTVPPAARISPAPLRPSEPMPVRTTARTAPS